MHPAGVRGAMRTYTPADRPLAVDWLGAFFAEAMPDSPEGRVERIVDDRAAGNGSLVLWEDDGERRLARGPRRRDTERLTRRTGVHATGAPRPRVRVGADCSAHGAAALAPPVLLPLHRPCESDVELDLSAHRVPARSPTSRSGGSRARSRRQLRRDSADRCGGNGGSCPTRHLRAGKRPRRSRAQVSM